MVLLLAIGGFRRGELAGIALDALDLEAGTISVFRNVLLVNEEVIVKETPKSDAGIRTISIPPALAELLKEQRAKISEIALKWGRDYSRKPMFLFPGVGGVAMNPRLISRRMERLANRAGINMENVSPCHSWRHTSASILWAATKDVKAIQERLGHSDPAITSALYIHNAPTADEAAAEVLGGLIRR
jgi:integrase